MKQYTIHSLLSAGLVYTLLLLSGCVEDAQPITGGGATPEYVTPSEKQVITPGTTDPNIEGWDLVWSDEFDGDSSTIDETKWSHEIWNPGRVNNESQAYTSRQENSHIENGYLTITALNDWSGGSQYTSARLSSAGKFDFTYGKVEVRAILPGGKGAWPAIWLLGSNIGEVGWPACGELDIMEHVGYDPHIVHSTAHAKNYYWQIEEQQTGHTSGLKVEEEYHTYGMEWFEDHIDFLFNGRVFFTAVPLGGDKDDYDAWPFSKDHFLILNIAVGGSWGGSKGIDEAAFPMKMIVDYVRVYKKQ